MKKLKGTVKGLKSLSLDIKMLTGNVWLLLVFITLVSLAVSYVKANQTSIKQWLDKYFSNYDLSVVEKVEITCDMGAYYSSEETNIITKCVKQYGEILSDCPEYQKYINTTIGDFEFGYEGVKINVKRYFFGKKRDEFNAKYILSNGKYSSVNYLDAKQLREFIQTYYRNNINEFTQTYGCKITQVNSLPPLTKFEPDEKTSSAIKFFSLREGTDRRLLNMNGYEEMFDEY